MSDADGALDSAACERARHARDARFDGRFYIGVRTTRVYCRPICPVRPPKVANVQFFPSAAAAAEAGFRPCLRCRPESSPGAPAARGTGATVTRALRLIDEGALDHGSVEQLASRLGVGSRHLARLFVFHLGASPIRVAQTRRLHLAMKLLNETQLSISQIAHAAGFGSVRRFNELVRSTYGRPPRSLRGRSAAPAGRGLQLQLAYRPPLDWPSLCGFLALRAVAGLEEVEGDTYRRSVSLNGSPGWIEVAPAGDGKLSLTVDLPDVTDLAAIVAQARRAFDLEADPMTIEQDLAADSLLADRVAAHPGLRVPGAWDRLELAVRAVLGQAVSVAAARTLTARVVQRFGQPLGDRCRGRITHGFPPPQTLAEADLRGVGLPATRAKAVRALARGVLRREIDLGVGVELEALTASLKTLPGVGPWTAQYIAMRTGHPDGFPCEDLGLRRGAAACFGKEGATLAPRELERRAERWRPWRAYAAMHLWSAYAELCCPTKRRAPTRRAKRST